MARILIVDDEPSTRELIGLVLRLEGHEVAEAADGAEALARVTAEIPDLVVLDLAMPGMDGWRFLEELYRAGIREQVRVILVSGHIDDVPDEYLEGSPSHFIAKPFDPQRLTATVRATLARDPRDVFLAHERSDSLARLMARISDVLH